MVRMVPIAALMLLAALLSVSHAWVPFHVYAEREFDWMSECNNHDLWSWRAFKHGDDVWFAEAAMTSQQHPWHVPPEEAQIFVVPVTLSLLSQHKQCGGKSLSKMMEELRDNLKKSPWYQRRNGRDHLFVAGTWRFANLKKQFQDVFENAIVVHFEHNKRKFWRCTVVGPYSSGSWERMSWAFLQDGVASSSLHELCPNRTLHDCVMPLSREFLAPPEAAQLGIQHRPYTFFFRGQIDSRAAYRSRRVACQAMPKIPGFHVCTSSSKSRSFFKEPCYDNVYESYLVALHAHGARDGDLAEDVVAAGDYVKYAMASQAADAKTTLSDTDAFKAFYEKRRLDQQSCLAKSSTFDYVFQLTRSKFCLMIRGDTPTSSRLYDCIRYSTIPVVLSNQIGQVGLPFQGEIPWKDIAYFVPETKDIDGMVKQLSDIASRPIEELEQKRLNMSRYARDLLWNLEGSRVFENILEEAQTNCLP